MARKKKPADLHFRIWKYRLARSACKGATDATTTPDPEKVSCQACKAAIVRLAEAA